VVLKTRFDPLHSAHRNLRLPVPSHGPQSAARGPTFPVPPHAPHGVRPVPLHASQSTHSDPGVDIAYASGTFTRTVVRYSAQVR